MLNLHVIQAAFGDSFILEYKEQDSSKLILIDGGPTYTYANHLKFAIDDIFTRKGRLDLIVLTHIDNDHICGIIDFLQDIKNTKEQNLSPILQIDGIWHNTFKQTIGIKSEIAPRVLDLAEGAERKRLLINIPSETVRGISQGEQTSKLARDLGIQVNAGFKDGLVLSENGPTPWLMEDLKIWIIGPNQHNLERLQREWLAWLEKKVLAPVTRTAEKDTSVPNLSSIMLLAEAVDRRILLTGDSISKDILTGLKSLGKLDASGKIHVDIIKLPHHGSMRNVSEEFFENVHADIYVISANGQNGNPEFGTLEWIITSAKRQKRTIQILATNETKSTRKLMQKYDQYTFGYTMVYMKAGQHYVTV
jgi:beta-lactamase superfamily II metal-dependent hydrolase